MSLKSNFKLKDYLSDDGKLDLSILNLKTVPNVNEIVSRIVLQDDDCESIFSWPYAKSNPLIYQIIKSNLYPHVFLLSKPISY